MKSYFRAYYDPTAEELGKLWEHGLVILDANALLNFFRYTPATRDAFFGVLDSREALLWIPYQVGLEFHSNRRGVIASQRQAFAKTVNALGEILNNSEAALDKLDLKRHSALDVGGMKDAVKSAIDQLIEDIEALRRQHDDDSRSREHDETLAHITRLYEGRVGGPYGDEALAKVYAEGKKRYAVKRPPGYKDSSKGEPGMYGDLVLWKQILDVGEDQKKPAIFVTEDVKEDWWLEVSGEKKGPRPELVEEYFEASGERIHFYTPERFIEFAGQRGVQVSIDARAEVEKVSDAQRRAADSAAAELTWRAGAASEGWHFSTRSRDTERALTMRVLAARQRIAEVSGQLVAIEERLRELDSLLFEYEDGQSSLLPIEGVSAERARLAREHAALLEGLEVAREALDVMEAELSRHDEDRQARDRIIKARFRDAGWAIPEA